MSITDIAKAMYEKYIKTVAKQDGHLMCEMRG